MNKYDINNNKWLVVPKNTFIDKIKDFFSNIFNIFKKEKNIDRSKESIIEENKILASIENEEKIVNIEKKLVHKKESQMIQNKVKDAFDDSLYYKNIYNGMKSGNISVDDLSPSEFFTIMKMQKTEHEFTLKKLQQAMNSYQSE